MFYFKTFLNATRPRTYPLALSGIIVANALAFSQLGAFLPKQWSIFAMSLWVALGLQILSNLANDYGDGIKGTDNHRTDRQTAQGNISPNLFKKIIIAWAAFVFACGVFLLWMSFDEVLQFLIFLGFGILAIFGAIAYTMGKNPYGYHAKGEIAVFLFFGLLNVLGGLYLQTQTIRLADIIAACFVGVLCSCVLMINNMRDIDSDRLAKKYTLAVKFGKETISHIYRMLILFAFFLFATFGVLQQNYYLLWIVLLIYPFAKHLSVIRQYSDEVISPLQLAPQLKVIVLLTLASSFLMSAGVVLFS